jgi:hypothetical protein
VHDRIESLAAAANPYKNRIKNLKGEILLNSQISSMKRSQNMN